MRGIPSTFLMFFFTFVLVVELISFFGMRILLSRRSKNVRIGFSVFYILLSLLTTGLLLYSFANPELLRQSRNYVFFYVVISVSFLNLAPKFVFALITLFTFPVRWFADTRLQIAMLAGSLLTCFGIFFVIAYGIFEGRTNLDVENQDIYLDNFPKQLDGLKIVQLSDIHLGSFGKNKEVMMKTVGIIKKLNPDLLLLTGDLVNNFSTEIEGFEPYLQQLTARYGKFAIRGNHDYGDYFTWPDSISKASNAKLILSGITDAGFKLLQNRWVKIAIKDTSFALIGVENWGHKPFPQYANLDLATKGIPVNSFKILMSHDPAFWKAKVIPQTNIPLTLSGHTHGGQFGVKIAGIEFSPIYFVEKCWGGLYKSDNQLLYVNRGLGTVGFPGRIEMRPEISVLTLFRTKNH